MTELTDTDVHRCSCGHAPKWHHDTRGCGYLGHAPDGRCPCLLTSDTSIDAMLAAARAEGARDMRTKIETLADDFHERAQAHTLRTSSSMSYRDAWQSATGALRALLADGGELQ